MNIPIPVETGIWWKPEEGRTAPEDSLGQPVLPAEARYDSIVAQMPSYQDRVAVDRSSPDAMPALLPIKSIIGVASSSVSSLLRQLANIRWNAKSLGTHMAYRKEIYECLPCLMEILSHHEMVQHITFRELTGMARLACWKGLVQGDPLLEKIDQALASKIDCGQEIPNEAIGEILMSYATVDFRDSIIAPRLLQLAAQREGRRAISTDDLIRTVWAAAVLEMGNRLAPCLQPAILSHKTIGNEKNLFRLYQAHLALLPIEGRDGNPVRPEMLMRRAVRGDGNSSAGLAPYFRKRLRIQLFKERKSNPRAAQSRFEKEVADCLRGLGFVARPQIYVFGFRFDIRLAAPEAESPDPARRVLIECDGPHHRVGWIPEGRQVGKDVLQDRLAAKYGFKLCRIPFRDWQGLSTEERSRYLMGELAFLKQSN